MNKAFDDFDTQINLEEMYSKEEYDALMLAAVTYSWLCEQAFKVKVWNN